MHCPSGNATDSIWRVLASSDGISSWTPLKPQHNNPNPLANQLWCIDFLTPCTPHHPSQTLCLPWISYATQKLMLDSCKMVEKQSEAFHTFLWHFFPSLKQNFIAYRSSKVSDCIFEIHQLWQSDFSRVYLNCCCRYSFEAEIMKIGQSSHKIYSNKILNFHESTTILNACTKSLETYWMHHVPSHTRWLCSRGNGIVWAGLNLTPLIMGFLLKAVLAPEKMINRTSAYIDYVFINKDVARNSDFWYCIS